MQKSAQHSFKGPRGFSPMVMGVADVAHFAALAGVGITLGNQHVRAMVEAHGFDANDVGIAPVPVSAQGTPSIAAQIQFLQAWLPGFVRVITAARKIDELVGISTVGQWEDEEVVQGVLEPIGQAVPYTDWGNIPLASWNMNFERRTIVRFEQGFSVGKLEELRTARMNVSTSAEKRTSAALTLDIQRNRVGFYGYNSGLNRTYGFLNDPNLPPYVTVANGASGSSSWLTKTMNEMTRDIRVGMSALRTQSMDTIDPKATKITLALPTNRIDLLTTVTDFGFSPLTWFKDNYPNVRIVSAPELNDANGGATAFYLYAESVDDGASDDSRVFQQLVPSKFFSLGVEKRAKAYLEDFSNATAGVLTKRPYAVYRGTGI